MRPQEKSDASEKSGIPSYEDSSYDPFKERVLSKPLTTFGAFSHLLKGSVGAGILAMPMGFKSSGLWTGLVLLFLTGIICIHCCYILVRASHKLCHFSKVPSLDYQSTLEAAYKHGPKKLQKFSKYAGNLVSINLLLAYYGICCVYIVFAATSSDQLVQYYWSSKIDTRIYMLVFGLMFMIVCVISELKYLVPFSIVANLCIATSLSIGIFYFTNNLHFQEAVHNSTQYTSFIHLSSYFSIVIYAMENIGIVLPVENDMLQPKVLLGPFGLLNITMGIIITIYGLVGFFGFLKYGEEIQANFILNLPIEEIAGRISKILILVGVCLTFALQYFVPMQLLCKLLENHMKKDKFKYVQPLFRMGVVWIIVAFAVAIPKLTTIIGLVGSICFSTLGVLFPVIIQILSEWGERGIINHVWFYKNILLVLFWLFVLLFGGYSSAKEVINTYT